MKVLICGSRDWGKTEEEYNLIFEAVANLPPETTIISGAAKGADTLAAKYGRLLGYNVIEFPADWAKFGRAAGPIRNKKMADQQPDKVIAFRHAGSKGTNNMIGIAKERGIEVEVIDR